MIKSIHSRRSFYSAVINTVCPKCNLDTVYYVCGWYCIALLSCSNILVCFPCRNFILPYMELVVWMVNVPLLHLKSTSHWTESTKESFASASKSSLFIVRISLRRTWFSTTCSHELLFFKQELFQTNFTRSLFCILDTISLRREQFKSPLGWMTREEFQRRVEATLIPQSFLLHLSSSPLVS